VTQTDPLDRVRLALARHAAKTPDPPTPECPDDDAIAALAEGTLEASARAGALPHLAACPRCRGAVASVARALADSSVASEIKAVEGGRRRRFYRVALIALPAAAALALLLARPRTLDEEASIHRAPTITAAPAPSPAAPVAMVSDARAFRWSAVPSADRYRLTLFDTEGRVRYETEVVGTAAALPDTVVLVPGARYLWKVEARTGFDRWSSSELVEFSIVRSTPR
jgi:anti-sigma factor ChrR (cupin superfamily)